MQPLSGQILAFYRQLTIPVRLPRGVVVMNPYHDAEAWTCCTAFYRKFYTDQDPRTMILGINPGRYGGGMTGIPFTDPVRLEQVCGIANNFSKRGELSSEFMYRVIEAWGGVIPFFRRFYFSAISPLGFTRNGKNLNYYDVPALQQRLTPLMHRWLQQQLAMGCKTDRVFCVGEAENYRFLNQLNATGGYFQEIIPLPHPRFIMQYRRKQLADYVIRYLENLRN